MSPRQARLCCRVFPRGRSETTALLRSVLDKVCEKVGKYEKETRTHIASELLEAAAPGTQTIEYFKETGREALKGVPTMWR
jgi:hypothetical protein